MNEDIELSCESQVQNCPEGWNCVSLISRTPGLVEAKLSSIVRILTWVACCEDKRFENSEKANLLRRARVLVEKVQRLND